MLEQQLINALSLGSVYALFALGFTLVGGGFGRRLDIDFVGQAVRVAMVNSWSIKC